MIPEKQGDIDRKKLILLWCCDVCNFLTFFIYIFRKSLAIVCQDKDDECYSQTTPFGVVHRGCFNARKNLTTYVCACNFCNHIPITELPYMFQSKSYWVKNVIELSRSQYLSRIVFKDMSCLRCEVNGTSKSLVNNGNILAELNCLSPTNM